MSIPSNTSTRNSMKSHRLILIKSIVKRNRSQHKPARVNIMARYAIDCILEPDPQVNAFGMAMATARKA